MLRQLFLLAGILSLSACSQVPERYVSSPILADYVATLMPDAYDKSILTVSVCQDRVDEDWYASVLFSDGLMYHYALSDADNIATPVNFADWPSSKARYADINPHFGCLGWTGTNYEFIAEGDYRIDFGRFGVDGAVHQHVAAQVQFDNLVKARLQVAAVAAKDAVRRHAAYVPISSSWGATTCKYVPVPGSWKKPCHL